MNSDYIPFGIFSLYAGTPIQLHQPTVGHIDAYDPGGNLLDTHKAPQATQLYEDHLARVAAIDAAYKADIYSRFLAVLNDAELVDLLMTTIKFPKTELLQFTKVDLFTVSTIIDNEYRDAIEGL